MLSKTQAMDDKQKDLLSKNLTVLELLLYNGQNFFYASKQGLHKVLLNFLIMFQDSQDSDLLLEIISPLNCIMRLEGAL